IVLNQMRLGKVVIDESRRSSNRRCRKRKRQRHCGRIVDLARTRERRCRGGTDEPGACQIADVVKNAETSTNRELAVAIDVPRQADSRTDVLMTGILEDRTDSCGRVIHDISK